MASVGWSRPSPRSSQNSRGWGARGRGLTRHRASWRARWGPPTGAQAPPQGPRGCGHGPPWSSRGATRKCKRGGPTVPEQEGRRGPAKPSVEQGGGASH
eukprot:340818-Alexandrium_andersonii.AAC.1